MVEYRDPEEDEEEERRADDDSEDGVGLDIARLPWPDDDDESD